MSFKFNPFTGNFDEVNEFSGANTTLSNLTSPTTINQHLLPDTTNTKNLGSNTRRWSTAYINSVNANDPGSYVRVAQLVELSTIARYSGGLTLPAPSQSSGTSTNPFLWASQNLNIGTRSFADTTNTDSVYIFSGDSDSGTTGSIFINSGTTSGTRGTISFGSDADLVKLETQPTGSDDLAVSTTKYVDDAVAAIGSSFSDASFEIINDSDNTKVITFDASAITTATTRNISMPDADVDLNKVNYIELDGSNNVGFVGDTGVGVYMTSDQWIGINSGNNQSIFLNSDGGGLFFPNGRTSPDMEIKIINETTADAVAAGNLSITGSDKSAGTGDGGSLIFRPGTSAGGTNGSINFNDLNLGAASAGYVWTLTDNSTGAGNWDELPASANQDLSNLTSPTAINQDLLPGTTNTSDLGSQSNRWAQAYVNDALIEDLYITSSNTGSAAMRLNASLNSVQFLSGTGSLETPNGTSSNGININTGNGSAGNSGSVLVTTGTSSGGTRGSFEVSSNYLELDAEDTMLIQAANNLDITSTAGTIGFNSSAGAINFNESIVDIVGSIIGGYTTSLPIKTTDNSDADAAATQNIEISSGNKSAGTGDSGNITLNTGTSAGGARGYVEVTAPVFVFPTATSDPATTYPNGSSYFNTSTNELKILNGGEWLAVTLMGLT